MLARHRLSATFFVTQPSPVLDAFRAYGDVELGLHPNFLPGSSHGSSPDEVLAHLRAWVPEAVGARAHCLVQGTPTSQAYRRHGLRYDAATLRDGVAGLEVFHSWTGLVEIPIWFEDDVHLSRGRSCRLDELGLATQGLHVMTFHPVLVALDATSLDGYGRLKADLAQRGRRLVDATEDDFAPYRDQGGIGTLFKAVAAWLAANPSCQGGPLRQLAP